jgi:hypothetical protein
MPATRTASSGDAPFKTLRLAKSMSTRESLILPTEGF